MAENDAINAAINKNLENEHKAYQDRMKLLDDALIRARAPNKHIERNTA